MLGISAQEHLIWRAMRQLGIELTCRARAQFHGVSGLGLEGCRDVLGRLNEIRGDGNANLTCSGMGRCGQDKKKDRRDNSLEHFASGDLAI